LVHKPGSAHDLAGQLTVESSQLIHGKLALLQRSRQLLHRFGRQGGAHTGRADLLKIAAVNRDPGAAPLLSRSRLWWPRRRRWSRRWRYRLGIPDLAGGPFCLGQLAFQLGDALLLGQLAFQLGDALLWVVLVHQQMVPPREAR